VAHDAWAHATATGAALYRVAWPGGPTVTADGRLEVASDAEAFTVTARVTATEDGAVVFERTWDERIPRDLV
jgi:hypothetical protein